jgi:hypothetical protein
MKLCHKDKKQMPSIEGTRLALIQEGILDERNPLLIIDLYPFGFEKNSSKTYGICLISLVSNFFASLSACSPL